MGRRDRVVPDRGRRRRGRKGRVDLGPILRHARQGAERRHGSGRVRLLPPLPGRHRADARARPARLSLLRRLAAHPPRGARPGQRGGPRLLRPTGGRPARGGHRAVAHPLPLGPAAAARGRRRLAGTRHGRRLRRVRRHRRPPPRRPRESLDHPQRALVRRLARVRIGRTRSRPLEQERRARRRAQPAPLARARRRRAPRRGPGRGGRDHAQPLSRRRCHGQRGRPRRRAARRRLPEPLVPRPRPPGRVPGGHGRGLRGRRAGHRRRRPGRDPAAARLPGRQLLLAPRRGGVPRRRPAALHASRGGRVHGHGLGGDARRASRASSSACTASTARCRCT